MLLIVVASLSGLLQCSSDTNCFSSQYCLNGYCEDKLTEGQTCDLRTSKCTGSLVCHLPPGGRVATCKQSQCTNPTDCPTGSRCFSGLCYPALQENDTCTEYSDACDTDLMCISSYNETTSTCTQIPCISQKDCPVNLYCDTDSSSCKVSSKVGDVCDPMVDNCVLSSKCLPTSSTEFRCTQKYCNSTAECDIGTRCVHEICTTVPDQDGCVVNADCTGFDTYPNNVCIEGYCHNRRLQLGDYCAGVSNSPPCLSTLLCAHKSQYLSQCEVYPTPPPQILGIGVLCNLNNNNKCHSAYECVQVSETEYRCQVTPITVGETCDPTSHIKCAYPHYCLRSSGTQPTYVCSDYLQLNDSCVPEERPCKEPAVCTSNRCQIPLFIEQGEECQVGGIPCQEPFACQVYGSRRICSEPRLALGDVCTPSGTPCLSPLVCLKGSGIQSFCSYNEISYGQACVPDGTPCALPFVCTGGIVGYHCGDDDSLVPPPLFLSKGKTCIPGGQPCAAPYSCIMKGSIGICDKQVAGGRCLITNEESGCVEPLQCTGSLIVAYCTNPNKISDGKKCEPGNDSCVSSSRCQLLEDGFTYCVPTLTLDEPCNSTITNYTIRCDDDLRCLPVGDDDADTRCSVRRCYSDSDCPSALYCDDEKGDCVDKLPEYSLCNVKESICEENLRCMQMEASRTQGVCMSQDCIFDGSCQHPSEQYCNLETGRCELRPDYVHSCNTSSDCLNDQVCQWGYCTQPKLQLGDECEIDSNTTSCLSSLTCQGSSNNSFCRPAPASLPCGLITCQTGLVCIQDECTTPVIVRCAFNERIQVDCNTCICLNGWWSCTQDECTPCSSSLSCPDDQFCKVSQQLDTVTNDLLCSSSTNKVCSPKAMVDEPCGPVGNELCRYEACSSGLKCIAPLLNPLVRGTCQNETLQLGEVCLSGSVSKRTLIDRTGDCDFGLECINGTCQHKQNLPPVPFVYECESDLNCSANQYCGQWILSTGKCSTDSTCLPAASLNEFCTDLSCGDRPCLPSLQCSSNTGGVIASGRKKCLPFLKTHDVCRLDSNLFDRSSDCPDGNICKMITPDLYSCEEPVAVIPPPITTERHCTSDVDCHVSETCTPQILQSTGIKLCATTRTCVSRAFLHEPCKTDGELPCFYKMCASTPGDELFCSSETNTCQQAFLFEGDVCVNREQSCPNGTNCVDGKCQSTKVTEPPVSVSYPFCSPSGQCPIEDKLECVTGVCSTGWRTSKCLDYRNPPITKDARSYCCLYHKVFCDPLGGSNTTTSCKIPISKMTREQQVYCCSTFQIACPIPDYDCSVSSTETSFIFNPLTSTFVENTEMWSSAKKQFCCNLKGIGCEHINCNRYSSHADSWQSLWCVSGSEKQQLSEELKMQLPLPGLNSACFVGSDNVEDWSDAKKRYCCLHEDVACPVDCLAELKTLTTAQRDVCCSIKGVYCSESVFSSSAIPRPNYRIVLNGFIGHVRSNPKLFLRRLLLLLTDGMQSKDKRLDAITPVAVLPYNVSDSIQYEYGVTIPLRWVNEAYDEMKSYTLLAVSDHSFTKFGDLVPIVSEGEIIEKPTVAPVTTASQISVDLIIGDEFVDVVRRALEQPKEYFITKRDDLLRSTGASLVVIDGSTIVTASPKGSSTDAPSSTSPAAPSASSTKNNFWTLSLIISSILCCVVLSVVGVYLIRTRKQPVQTTKSRTQSSLLEMEMQNEPELIVAT